MTSLDSRPIKIFTPSCADAENTNAQNLTVKEIVARLPEEFHVTMLCEGDPDPRLQSRSHTRLFRCSTHGNTLRLLPRCLFPPPDIYFFPRTGPLDRLFFDLKKHLRLRTAVISYIVTVMNQSTATGMVARSIREGEAVFGNSRYVSDSIRQVLGVRAGTIYDGVDRRFYFPAPIRTKNRIPIVLYAGSFQPRKRVEFVICEAARLPHVEFRLAGKGETEEHCRELAQRLCCSNITFLGHLSSERLGEEMRRADVFLFPGVLEGNPQVLLQASACALPCAAMNLYRSDYIVDGKTGFQAPSDAELSASLDRLLSDTGLRRSLGDAAAMHALQFNWDDVARQWTDVFRKISSKTRAQSELRACEREVPAQEFVDKGLLSDKLLRTELLPK